MGVKIAMCERTLALGPDIMVHEWDLSSW